MIKYFSSILFLFLFMKCFSQVNVNWKSNIEFYSHNSSTYVSADPAIDFVLLDTMVFAITQNGNLSCLNQHGEVLWKKKIVVGENSNIYSGVNIKVIDDNNILITSSYDIKKYSAKGKLIWETEIKLFKKKYYINSVLISQDNSIYLTANLRDKYSMPLTKSYLFKYDANGKLLWKRVLSSQEDYDNYRPTKGITEINQDIFAFGNTHDVENNAKTTIYKFNKKGKLINTIKLEGYTNSIRSKDNSIFILVGSSSFNTSYIQIITMANNLEIIDDTKKTLPINSFYLKENYDIDTLKRKIIKTYYTKIPAKKYNIKDFVIDSENSFVITGSSNKNLWITKLGNDTIIIDWKMDYLYKMDPNKNSYYQKFNNIQVKNNNFYLSGICVDNENFNTDWIKLFIFKVDFITE